MLIPAAWLTIALAQVPPVVTPPPEGAFSLPADGREPTDIPADLHELREASLPPVQNRNAKDQATAYSIQAARVTRPVGDPRREQILVADRAEFNSRGLRFFRIQVQPGETLQAAVAGAPAEKVFLRFWVPPPADAFSARLLNSNKAMRNLSQKVQFKNTAPVPYGLVIVAEGFTGYPYRLTLERSKA